MPEEPPGAGREHGVATGEVVGACTAELVPKRLVALQGLDAHPPIPAGHTRRKTATWLARIGAVTPVLPEHGLATNEIDALLAALGSSLGLGLVDLLADEPRILGMARALEA